MKRILSRARNFLKNPRLPKVRAIKSTAANNRSPQNESTDANERAQPDRLQSQSPAAISTLESLPPEVHRFLLSMLGIDEMRALVSSSPVIHARYLVDRRYLLCRSLDNTLGCVSIDALAVFRSSSADFAKSRTRENVTGFLKLYQDQRGATEQPLLPRDVGEDEAVGMVMFHNSIVQPLARYYFTWSLGNLAREPGALQSREPPSRTEETRLMRAMYRFQIVLQPVEEIACINTFATEKYDRVFSDIRWDVHEENPKFDGQRPPTPDGAFDFDNSWTRLSLLRGTISRGLELLYSVIFKVKDHEHLVSMMQEEISFPLGNVLDDAFSEGAQFHRRRNHPSKRDLKQTRRKPLPFTGETNASDLLPPLGWTIIWHGTYSNLYGYYVQDCIRRWGYVIWDAVRLERTNATEVLAQQWRDDWGDSDPRNNLL
ncbi:hypothetical protein H634G_10728 [Metarhizium anisopliae BRIP 53293]|uniref:F-box domain-containing protein n=1 Tax=Metarhizium anisopliae BRIP 53293 TaxID=1291518 RepID=A0A0D9NIV7_METAN|nr:hypothetical protein H634G_10728 [Metarhizium anisopliae BRIP 53293]KJK92254.1 hypothetical protein H633G_03869 [Metarhizium anisopliae BRIP 53284]